MSDVTAAERAEVLAVLLTEEMGEVDQAVAERFMNEIHAHLKTTAQVWKINERASAVLVLVYLVSCLKESVVDGLNAQVLVQGVGGPPVLTSDLLKAFGRMLEEEGDE